MILASVVSAEKDATLDAYWYYVQNCEDCTRKRDGEKKVAGICQRAHETVDAQFPADRSYDGLLRYLASCNDLPPVCGACRRMGEAIKLVAEIESRLAASEQETCLWIDTVFSFLGGAG